MKILALLFLIGFVSAFLDEELSETADEYISNIIDEVEQGPSLEHHVALEEVDERINDLTKLRLKLGKQLKETLNKILEKIRTAVEQGKVVEKEVLDKLREVRDRLKRMREELGEDARELLHKIHEKAKEYVNMLLDKLTNSKRDVQDQVQAAMAELNLRDVLLKIRDHLKKNVDPELLKEKVEKIFAEGSEILRQFLQLIKEKAKNKLIILIDTLLDEDEDLDEVDRAPRGIRDYWEKVKNYFKDLKIDLQEKYMKFGEWVKNTLDKGMETSNNKMENIKAIAIEFAKHAKGISKEVANEAGEFFKQYKEELGNIWEEIKERIQEIRNRKD